MAETRAKTTRALEEHVKKQDLQLLEICEWRKQMEEKLSNWGSLLEAKVDKQATHSQMMLAQLNELLQLMNEQKKEKKETPLMGKAHIASSAGILPTPGKVPKINLDEEESSGKTVMSKSDKNMWLSQPRLELPNFEGMASSNKLFQPQVRNPHVMRNTAVKGTGSEGFKRLSPQEIQYRRNNQLCWKCKDKWGPGHVCKIKQLNVIVAEDDEDLRDLNIIEEGVTDAGNVVVIPEDHIQTITQMDECWAVKEEDRKIIVIIGFINQVLIKILIDTGASRSFINDQLVRRMRFPTRTIRPFMVTVAGGYKIRNDQLCPETIWSIQQYDFRFDLKVIDLGEWDIILGTDWLSRFSPITFDYDRFTIHLNRKGERFLLKGEAYETHRRIEDVLENVEFHKRKREQWQREQEIRVVEYGRTRRATEAVGWNAETRAKTTRALEEHVKKQDLQLLEICEWRKQMEEKLSNWGSLLEAKVDKQATHSQMMLAQLNELLQLMNEQKKEKKETPLMGKAHIASSAGILPTPGKVPKINLDEEESSGKTVMSKSDKNMWLSQPRLELPNFEGMASSNKLFQPQVRNPHVMRNTAVKGTGSEGFKRLSPQEIQYRRNNQLCWKCKDKWGPGHVCKIKQLNVIVAEDDEDLRDLNIIEEGVTDAGNVVVIPEDHIQTITQMDECWAVKEEDRKIIVIIGFINQVLIKILIDTGASRSFINDQLVRRMRFPTRTIRPFMVTVAGGYKIRNDQLCPETIWSIQQYDFRFDLKVIDLGEWDIILGTDWLSRFSPITFDYDRFTIHLNRKGERFLLKGEAYETHRRIEDVLENVEFHKRKREQWQREQEIRVVEYGRTRRATEAVGWNAETRAKTTRALEEHVKKQDLQLLEICEWRKQMEEKLSNWGSLLEAKVDKQATHSQMMLAQLNELLQLMNEQKKEKKETPLMGKAHIASSAGILPTPGKVPKINLDEEESSGKTVMSKSDKNMWLSQPRLELPNFEGMASSNKLFQPQVRNPHVMRNTAVKGTGSEGFKRLSPQEIQYRRNNQLCWKCKDKWGPGHVCKIKQLNVIVAEDDEDLRDLNIIEEGVTDAGNVVVIPEDHIQTITQMDECWAVKEEDRKIIVIIGFINQVLIKILIDTGASRSFINDQLVRRMRFPTRTIRPFMVTVAGGYKIRNDQLCPETIWSIQQYDFRFDLKVIDLGEWDIILGTDWLSRFSPITFDYDRFTIHLNRKGERFLLKGEAYETHRRIEDVLENVEFHKRKREQWQREQEIRVVEYGRTRRATEAVGWNAGCLYTVHIEEVPQEIAFILRQYQESDVSIPAMYVS
ncbi:OLC1v1017880C1 [Oldenlandia corymbosa var. corymbosa]|uniref:OLC1v1017880C1 n=1 Tax=Oldenlandia corymbosa var. corymbosa TaxID=529605 RepID=A0AAV1EAF2_OLDCO|nr:OLC1v1017880C1 [Oldenlandia corymbosa var. corymbosa]